MATSKTRQIRDKVTGNDSSNGSLSFPSNLPSFGGTHIQFQFINTQTNSPRGGRIQLYVPAQPKSPLSADYTPQELILKEFGSDSLDILMGNVGRVGGARDLASGAARRFFPGSSQDVVGSVDQSSVNPKMEYIFRNMTHRTFQFQFMMVPANQSEAIAIENIVRQFRESASAGMGPATGAFLFYPDLVKVKYSNNIEQHMHKFKDSVIKSVDVTYNPLSQGTWTHHRDYQPTGVTLDLTFEEIEIVSRQDVTQGY